MLIEIRLDNLFVSTREIRSQPMWQSEIAHAFDTAMENIDITPLNASSVVSIGDTTTMTLSTRRLRRQWASPVYVHIGVAVGYLNNWEMDVVMAYLSQPGTMATKMANALRFIPVFSTVVVTVTSDPSLVSTAAPSSISSQTRVFDSNMHKWGAAESFLVLLLLALSLVVLGVIAYQRHKKAYVTAITELSPTGQPPNCSKRKKETRRSVIKLNESVTLACSGRPVHVGVCSVAQLEENQDLNRSPHAIPFVVPNAREHKYA